MSELGGIGSVNFLKNRNDILITATSSGETDRGIPIICTPDIWRKIDSELQRGPVQVDFDGAVDVIPSVYSSFLLRQAQEFPIVGIRLTSLLNVSISPSNVPIVVYPWTIFETADRNKPIAFTFYTHNFFDDDLRQSVKWIKDYVEKEKGKLIVTEFDEEINFLDAHFPLSDCLKGNITEDQIVRYCQSIQN